MIQKKGTDLQYLEDFREGRIKQGLGIGSDLDKHLRFKRGQLNIVSLCLSFVSFFKLFFYVLC